MPLSINHNLIAQTVQRNLFNTNRSVNDIMQRLSTGMRINGAKDDAANLALSEKVQSKISGLDVANKNIQSGIAKLETYDGYLDRIAESLQKIRDLAVQAANGVYSESERAMLNDHAQELLKDVEFTVNGANEEIGAPKVNTTTFVNEQAGAGAGDGAGIVSVKKLSEAEAVAQGYTIISTASDFQTQLNSTPAGKFILMGDIDMSELGTITQSAITNTFTGELNGNGFAIDNLSIDTNGADIDNIGLFAEVDGAKLENIDMRNVSIASTDSSYVGALAGRVNGGSIYNVSTSGSLSARSDTGGIAGQLISSEISNSQSSTSLEGDTCVGGLIGTSANDSTIKNSYATGSIKGTSAVGGLVGQNRIRSVIDNSYAKGTVAGHEFIGGLSGYQYGNAITRNSYASGDVDGDNNTGGLVGYSSHYSTVSNSYTTGSIKGVIYTGGLVGQNYTSTVENSYSISDIDGHNYAGGLVGYNYATSKVEHSYSTGHVQGNDNVGGLVGYNRNNSEIINSYATGDAEGRDQVGGFVGYNAVSSTVINSYATGNANGSGESTGGFVGSNHNNSIIQDSYSTGNVQGASHEVGGFVGLNQIATVTQSYSTGNVIGGGQRNGGFAGYNFSGTIKKSYSTGSVEAVTYAGGFVGYQHNGLTEDCYSTGSVEGSWATAGFVAGINGSTINNCYTTSHVDGNTWVGAFLGRTNSPTSTVNDTNFYDNNMSTDSGASNATTDRTAATAGWDSAIWDISADIPQHLWDQDKNIFSLQIGADSDATSRYDMKFLGLDFNEMGGLGIGLSTASDARDTLSQLDKAIEYLSAKRSEVGSNINILGSTIQRNSHRNYNLMQTNSTLRDADIATEMLALMRHQILQQASVSLLQQVRGMNSEIILSLLKF